MEKTDGQGRETTWVGAQLVFVPTQREQRGGRCSSPTCAKPTIHLCVKTSVTQPGTWCGSPGDEGMSPTAGRRAGRSPAAPRARGAGQDLRAQSHDGRVVSPHAALERSELMLKEHHATESIPCQAGNPTLHQPGLDLPREGQKCDGSG